MTAQDPVIVVTGGAGYVGGAITAYLARAGVRTLVVDKQAPGPDHPGGWIRASVGDESVWQRIRDSVVVRAVIHCAGLIVAPESMRDPAPYFVENVAESMHMLAGMERVGLRVPLVFSSSAAVYGEPPVVPIPESTPCQPTTPYGQTKRQFEEALVWYGLAYGLPWMALRYFNAAGAFLRRAEQHRPETHLLPLTFTAAVRERPITVYGDDYPTPDGTAIRDYVHVEDLARAHLAAVEVLEEGRASQCINLGSGTGHSVREMIHAVERVVGRALPADIQPRRPGDPAVLVADIRRAREVLHWEPQVSSADRIVEDAWQAFRKWPQGTID